MSLSFPSWWKGGFPDAEAVVRDALLPFTSQITPSPAILAWLPSDYKDFVDSGSAIISLFRINGIRTPKGKTDSPIVQVGVISKTRAESVELMEFIREILAAYEEGGRVRREDGSISVIKTTIEVDGPELTPERVPDFRLVYAAFEVVTAKPVGAPDYRGKVLETVG